MSDQILTRTAGIFITRLRTLLRLLDLAEAQWREKGRQPEALLGGRLAEDMLPLPYQIVFACNQPNDLASWLQGSPNIRVKAEEMSLAELRTHVEAAIARQTEIVSKADVGLLDREKHIDLMHGMSVHLTGRDYIDDWLMPNFYFHLVTAYDILRSMGVTIGKADYMVHLADRIRRAA
ncbi:MAG: DUF1993 domain-containing protein [Pararhizobium sp.]